MTWWMLALIPAEHHNTLSQCVMNKSIWLSSLCQTCVKGLFIQNFIGTMG